MRMADNKVPIASAVILPINPPDTGIIPAKRRQSASPDSDSKRACLEYKQTSEFRKSTADSNAQENITTFSLTEKNEERRRSSLVEEKKRGQRLLGGLLNVLSQNTQNSQQNKRLENNKRQLERSKSLKLQNSNQGCGRVTKLLDIQKSEQLKFEEESTRTRHANMHLMANFLYTKTEPRLYYKPWELLPEQRERIESQISSVTKTIGSQIPDLNRQNTKLSEPMEENKSNEKPEESISEPQIESQTAALTTNAHVTTANTLQTPEKIVTNVEEKGKEKEKEEHNGEVMVENEEDTVIY